VAVTFSKSQQISANLSGGGYFQLLRVIPSFFASFAMDLVRLKQNMLSKDMTFILKSTQAVFKKSYPKHRQHLNLNIKDFLSFCYLAPVIKTWIKSMETEIQQFKNDPDLLNVRYLPKKSRILSDDVCLFLQATCGTGIYKGAIFINVSLKPWYYNLEKIPVAKNNLGISFRLQEFENFHARIPTFYRALLEEAKFNHKHETTNLETKCQLCGNLRYGACTLIDMDIFDSYDLMDLNDVYVEPIDILKKLTPHIQEFSSQNYDGMLLITLRGKSSVKNDDDDIDMDRDYSIQIKQKRKKDEKKMVNDDLSSCSISTTKALECTKLTNSFQNFVNDPKANKKSKDEMEFDDDDLDDDDDDDCYEDFGPIPMDDVVEHNDNVEMSNVANDSAYESDVDKMAKTIEDICSGITANNVSDERSNDRNVKSRNTDDDYLNMSKAFTTSKQPLIIDFATTAKRKSPAPDPNESCPKKRYLQKEKKEEPKSAIRDYANSLIVPGGLTGYRTRHPYFSHERLIKPPNSLDLGEINGPMSQSLPNLSQMTETCILPPQLTMPPHVMKSPIVANIPWPHSAKISEKMKEKEQKNNDGRDDGYAMAAMSVSEKMGRSRLNENPAPGHYEPALFSPVVDAPPTMSGPKPECQIADENQHQCLNPECPIGEIGEKSASFNSLDSLNYQSRPYRP